MAGESPAIVASPLLPASVSAAEQLEVLADERFLGLTAEPFAAVVPMREGVRLIHLSNAQDVRSHVRQKKQVLGRPAPFLRQFGDTIPFLPVGAKVITTTADLSAAADHLFEYKARIEASIRNYGQRDFLVQVDQARAYFRGSEFWRLQSLRRLNPDRPGYPVSWLKGEAEKHSDGLRRVQIDEVAVIVAADFEELATFAESSGVETIIR
jgi:hypothetical protein